MSEEFADISHHNGTVNLAAYRNAGYRRIITKATEGTAYVDPTFEVRWRAADILGLDRVAYHFARAKFNGADEFDHLISVVNAAGGLGPRDRLCLDAEDTETPGRARANAAEFTARAVQRGYGVGLFYTGKWYADPNRLTADCLAPRWRQLWLSDYTPGQADSAIEVPVGWARSQIAARQYSSTVANVPGIGTCDMSRVLNDWLPAHAPQPSALTPRGSDMDVLTSPGKPAHALVPGYAPGIRNAAVVSGLRKAAAGQDATAEEYDAVLEFIDGTDIVQGWATGRHDDGAATLREMLDQWPAVRDKVNGLAAGGGQLDMEALANLVADKLAARLAQ